MEEFWNGKSEDTQKELLIDGDPEAVKELEDKEDLSSSSSSSSSDDEDEAPGPGEELIPSTDPGPGPVLVVVEDPSSSSSDEDEAPAGLGEELIPSTEPDPGPGPVLVVVDDNNVTDDDSGLVTAPEPDYRGTESEVAAQWDEPEELVVAETISALLPENWEAAASKNEAESSGTNVKVFPTEEEESLVADEDSSPPLPPPSENVPTVEAESGSSVIVVEEIPECIGNPVLITTVVAREVRNPTSWRSCCGLFEVLRRHDRSS